MTKKLNKILAFVFCGTSIAAGVVWFLGYDFKIPIGLGVLISLMLFFLWDAPPKHKEFSDADRLQATTRALGGSPQPELWTPDMPEKGKKHRKKKPPQTHH